MSSQSQKRHVQIVKDNFSSKTTHNKSVGPNKRYSDKMTKGAKIQQQILIFELQAPDVFDIFAS